MVFLTGRAFAASDPRVLGVRRLPDAPPGPAGPALALGDVAEAFAAVAEAGGAGARQARAARLRELAARATPPERRILGRILAGEMRTGASDGLVLEAIARAAGAPAATARRAALLLGDLAAVAELAARDGAEALAAAT
ncbi:MAG TPA: hypothetical protein DDZ42_20665, partial [Candidatus Rokubacteria bacterium]|nr:hypothetical protein [Candidatus Rokubacteria bacterium]